MKNIITIIIMLLLSNNAESQQLYDYYNGYVKGYQKGCNCRNEIPNKSTIMNKSGYFSEGYDAGFVDGRIFYNKNNKNDRNNNVSGYPNLYQPDYNVIYSDMSRKQALIDERRKIIQQKYNDLEDLAVSMIERRANPKPTESDLKYWNEIKTLTNTYGNYDLTNNQIFNQILDFFNEQRKYILTWK